MTTRMQVHISCDRQSCAVATAGGVGENYWDLAQRLRARGWLIEGSETLCPTHAAGEQGLTRKGPFHR